MYRTLKKLRKESPRRFKELRQLCDDLTGSDLNF